MEVILKEEVVNLGNRGDVVKVADGYARNYLLPRKLAMKASAENKAVIEQMKAAAARRAASERAQAQELAEKINAVAVTFVRKTGENGHLFGSVTTAEIAAELATQGFEIDRRKIVADPLKAIGEYTIPVKLYRSEVVAQIKVTIADEDAPAEPVAAEAEAAVEETPAAEAAAE